MQSLIEHAAPPTAHRYKLMLGDSILTRCTLRECTHALSDFQDGDQLNLVSIVVPNSAGPALDFAKVSFKKLLEPSQAWYCFRLEMQLVLKEQKIFHQ